MNTKAFFSLGAFFFFLPQHLYSAPCCAANGAVPSLITTDEKFQFAGNVGSGNVYGWAYKNTLIQGASQQEKFKTFTLDGSMLITERFQVGISLPVMTKSLSDSTLSETGLADIRLNSAYELFPEFVYSRFRPKGFLFFQMTLPTGKPAEKALLPRSIDALGEGRTSFSLGILIMKAWALFDFYWFPQGIASLPKTARGVEHSSVYRIGSILGIGINVQQFRIGLRIDPIYQFPHTFLRSGEKRSSLTKFTNSIGLEASYMINKQLSVRAMAFDQSILHLSFNTSVSRGASVGVMYRIPQ